MDHFCQLTAKLLHLFLAERYYVTTLRSAYGMSRPSVICLSSVCDVVAPYLEGRSLQ